MSSTDVPPSIACPNCGQTTPAKEFERRDHGTVRIYVCYDCSGIWFDHFASVSLAPTAVIELFKEIAARKGGTRQALSRQLNCPRCREALTLSFDLCKTGRFSYFSCHQGDGRFTPFFQFLREKQFVRTLSTAEIQRLKAQVRQISCSECGAPIDLEHDGECQYCHAPVSFLDSDAVEKAAKIWSNAANPLRTAPSADALGAALLKPKLGAHDDRFLLPERYLPHTSSAIAPDLIAAAIDVIGCLFD